MNLKSIISYLLLSQVWFFPLHGKSNPIVNEKQPVLYYADSQTYDRELGILILKGNVEFEQQGTILEADYVSYNENTDRVVASGNVRLRQPNGDINFAEYIELTGDLKEGVVLSLRTLLEDNTKIAAIEGRKFADREELDQVVYTPCELCGNKFPTWQINSPRVIKDNTTNDIHFTDAQFRFLDVPLLYLPYATQPLERRSGFLIPTPNYSTNFGALIKIPYYIALSEDKDLTITPVFFTEQNPLILGGYRQAFGNGYLDVEGSVTNYKKSEKDKRAERRGTYDIPNTRGHFFADGEFNLTDIWRVMGSGGVVSDPTYFRKYSFSGWQSEKALTSQGVLEGFLNQRDYGAGKLYHFQDLQNTDQKHISAALPFAEYSAYSGIDPLGGRFTFDGNLLNLSRRHGINYQRGIGEIGWQRPWNIPFGQALTVFGSARGDLYQIENFHSSSQYKQDLKNRREGGGRFFPQTGIDWRWPFISTCYQQSYILQPIGKLIVAPEKAIGISEREIPNEDSVDSEFNDINIFSSDRFSGYDKIETGSRAVYGGQFLTTGELFGDVDIFLGQSYSFSNSEHTDLSKLNHKDLLKRGLEANFVKLSHHLSDYVGRIEASPVDWLTLNYRFRLDRKSLAARVSELGGSIGPAIAKLAGTYVFISKHAGLQNKRNFNQINLTFTSQMTKYWSLKGLLSQNLKKNKENGGPLLHGIGLFYRDDCFGLGLTISRQYYKTKDVEPATIYLVTLFLKNIGDFNYSFNPMNGLFGENDPKNDTP